MSAKYKKLQLATLAATTKHEGEEGHGEAPPSRLFLSENSKTGCSINVSIAKTCQPTAACMTYCYGLEARLVMPAALRRQVENYQRFEYLADAPEEDLLLEAGGVAWEAGRGQDFLRFFGVGDLQAGSARFINTLSRVAPKLQLWVATRKFKLAATLDQRPNVHVMLSLDATTPTPQREAAEALAAARGPQYFLAWVQTDEVRAPATAQIVFAEHHSGRRASFATPTLADPRTCPATIREGASHENACAACRACFDLSRRQTFGYGLTPLSTLPVKENHDAK